MKQQPTKRRSAVRPASDLVPTFGECVTVVMDALSRSRDPEEQKAILPFEKHRFNQMERRPDKLALEDYAEIHRRVLALGLEGVKGESKEKVTVLEEELREFFKRYKILSWQIVPGSAEQHQVLWALAHRFFIPWLALRIAFRWHDHPDASASVEDCWFVPLRRGEMYSCVMKVVDRFVREEGQSNAALAIRLCKTERQKKNKRYSVAMLEEMAMKQEAAQHLEGNISKYAHFKTTPPDGIIELIVEAGPPVANLRLMLVLARAIDRCVRHALKVFEDNPVLELLKYYALSFQHFRSLLAQLRSEFPTADHDEIWMYLHSPTFTGNTPGQQDRLYPLLDEYLNELPRKINAELRRTVRIGEPCRLPRDLKELNAGQWCFPKLIPIPIEIENAPGRETVSNAVAVSHRTFRWRINTAQAIIVRGRFTFMGMETFTALARGYQGHCTDKDAKMALVEAKRLFQLIYGQVPAGRKLDEALAFLEFLIEPFRPKLHEERKLARTLFSVVRKFYRKDNRQGAVEYLDGCLHALEGKDNEALRAFSRARKIGSESCGQYWIDLLRVGLMTAERAGSKREKDNFIKLLKFYGVFSNDAALEDNFRRVWTAGFKSFPRPA